MNEEERKKRKDFSGLGDDSGEMDVIKDVFSSPGPGEETADIFSKALFDSGKQAETEPVEKKEEEPSKEEPVSAETEPSEESTVHVVTDQDLKGMFEEPAKDEQPGQEEAKEDKPLPFERPPEESREAAEAAEEGSAEEVIEEIEERAESGEIKPVEAPRIGPALERIKNQIESLETMGGDFMSTGELKKLFRNVNIMITLIQEVMHQLEVMEKNMIEKGLLKPDDLDKW
jgi:hypothetical protein